MSMGPSFEQHVTDIARDIISNPARRADAIVDYLEPHIASGSRVIDIGAGGCRVAQHLIRRAGASVLPIDTVQFNETDDLYLHLYDDRYHLPFKDRSFDT